MLYLITALLVVVIILQVVSLLKKSSSDESKTYIKDAEDRLTRGIDTIAQNQSRSVGEIKLAISESNKSIGDSLNNQFSDMIRKDAEAQRSSDQKMSQGMERMQQALEFRMDAFKTNVGDSLKDINDKLVETVKENSEGQKKISDNLGENLAKIQSVTEQKLNSIEQNMNDKLVENVRENSEGQKRISNDLSERLNKIQSLTEDKLNSIQNNMNEKFVETVRENAEGQKQIKDSLNESLLRIQTLTEEKLNGIQKDVNDKLDASLNKRLDESFEKVTNQLSQLYKSLGELGEMSDGISNLNKTLSNVKTRGTWGEIQLGNILEETMTEAQYAKNIKLKKNTDDIVEFAIKIPARDDGDEIIYLPIDSKFPLDIYGNLVDAADSGSKESYDKYVKELENRIKNEARTIRDKYVNPPVTTDFAIMFLPTESLYAEVLRINGLAEFCQNKYRVIIASPSTITALLNSLRVGFANVALNKKTAEVRKILEAVKAQYGKLDELIDATKKKLDAAVVSTENLKDRTRKIQKSMSKIGEIDQKEADSILLIESSDDDA